MRNKIHFLVLIILGFVALCSCDGKETEVSFSNSTTSNLVVESDYTNHSNAFDGQSFIYDNKMWYINDLKDVPLPDPQVYVENDLYYIIGTSDRNNNVVDCYVTEDFVNYETHFAIYDPAMYNGWERNSSPTIFAPEMYYFNGTYYLYYSAIDDAGVRRNSVVISDNPLGPFEPLVNETVNGLSEPIFQDPYNVYNAVLDSSIFVDDNNEMYMYYSVATSSNQHIVGVKLDSPYSADWSTYTKLVVPGALNSINSVLKPLTWEMFRESLPIAEAPFMIKSKGKYYLTYSVNGCWNKYYNVCYAVSDSPLGNFEKPYAKNQIWTNLLLGYPGTNVEGSTVFEQWSGFASGTAHHCFFKVGDQIMIGYHAHKNRNWNEVFTHTSRYFAFDYLHFDENGVPFCNGPTYSPQPLPEAISGYRNIALDATVRVENVENSWAINDNYHVDCYNLTQEAGKEVVLGSGYSYIELSFDKEYTIGGIAIYNSSYYEKVVYEVAYIDFMNGNAVLYPEFCAEKFIDDFNSFIYPNSAITIEFTKTFKASKVVICVNLPEGGQLNEIVVLGK